jgi:hypothetical protein
MQALENHQEPFRLAILLAMCPGLVQAGQRVDQALGSIELKGQRHPTPSPLPAQTSLPPLIFEEIATRIRLSMSSLSKDPTVVDALERLWQSAGTGCFCGGGLLANCARPDRFESLMSWPQ